MSKLKILASIVTAAMVAVACSGPASTGGTPSSSVAATTAAPTTAAPTAAAPIRVTLLGTFTGQNADLGNWMYNGVKLAVDEANAAGGVSGRKIDLVKYDDQGQPTVATDLTQRAISEKTTMVYGSDLSTLALAMIPIMTSAKIPMITSGQAPALLQQKSPFVFIDSTTSVVFDQTLAKYVLGTMKATSIAMISNNGTYGKGEHDSFLAELTKAGVTPTSDKVIAPDVKDFTSVLTEIRGTNPKVLFIGAEEVQSGLIAKTQQQLDYLRRLGDRNYFQFTLRKGAPPVAISTIKLRLRKADQKHSRYSLDIFSDDKRLEKKNRDLDEPLQFYSGKPPLLFEVVINQINQNEASGYL